MKSILLLLSLMTVSTVISAASCDLTGAQKRYCRDTWGHLPRSEMRQKCNDHFCGSVPPPATYPVGTKFSMQISGAIDTTHDVSVFVLDLWDAPQATINTLKASNKKVIAYMSAGSWEAWRADAGDFPESVKGNDLGPWAGEQWLDITNTAVIYPIMSARMSLAASKGFDGVDVDNVDGYTKDTGFTISAAQQITYNTWLADEAHRLDLDAGLKNDVWQAADLVDKFDFAINEECFTYNECHNLAPFIAQDKAVYQVQYDRLWCSESAALGFYHEMKLDTLNSWRMTCGSQPIGDVFPGTQRRFAPSILLTGGGGTTVRQFENLWDNWVEPFYRDWLDPAENTKMGIYHPAFALKRFYNYRPSNYSNPNDGGYNWSEFDSFLNIDPIRDGKAKFHWMLDVEGSTLPQWMHSAGLVHLGPGARKPVIDFQKAELVKAMKGFWDAYAAKYDNDERVYTVLIDEDQSHGGVDVNQWAAGKKAVYRHMNTAIKKHSVVVTFNPTIINDVLIGTQIGPGVSDINMFNWNCGSQGNHPVSDCEIQSHLAMQNNTNNRPVAALSISHGYKINGSNKGWSSVVKNPWGRGLPTPQEPPKNSDTNVTPAIYAWYVSGPPRAAGSKADSGLGQLGADPAGIIPSHFFCIPTAGKRHQGETPADWDRALSIFGASGTKAVPALPYGWLR